MELNGTSYCSEVQHFLSAHRWSPEISSFCNLNIFWKKTSHNLKSKGALIYRYKKFILPCTCSLVNSDSFCRSSISCKTQHKIQLRHCSGVTESYYIESVNWHPWCWYWRQVRAEKVWPKSCKLSYCKEGGDYFFF